MDSRVEQPTMQLISVDVLLDFILSMLLYVLGSLIAAHKQGRSV